MMNVNTEIRNAWNHAYAKHMHKLTGVSLEEALRYADAADDYFNDECDPISAVDEELTYWGD